MTIETTNNKRIAKNALMLYIRMFFTMAISFYTSRIVLIALGISDYGVYNVVGGITILINVFISSLGSSTSRFLTYSLGKNDINNLKQTFCTAVWVHFGLATVFVLAAETIGLWFVNTQLVIPEGRLVAANWVYQSSIVSVIMSITQTPYSASITSHERMSAFAFIEVLLALSKLGIAVFVLLYDGDHLILYSILYALVSIIFQSYYRYYCIRHFEECHIRKYFNKVLFKDMFQFSSWTMLGSVSLTFMNQGMNVLINRFFGTLLNAAAGVALQVQGLIYTFRGNATLAFTPQIIKSYSASNYERVNQLIGIGTRFSAIVEIILIVPLIINMDFLMALWLKEVPVGAVAICQILLITNLLNSFNPFVNSTIIASGKIKFLNIIISLLYVVFIVGTYCLLKLYHSYLIAYAFCVFVSPFTTVIYLSIVKKLLPLFSARSFVFKIYLPLLVIALFDFFVLRLISNSIESRLISFIISSFVSLITVSIMAYLFVFDKGIKQKIKKYVGRMLH